MKIHIALLIIFTISISVVCQDKRYLESLTIDDQACEFPQEEKEKRQGSFYIDFESVLTSGLEITSPPTCKPLKTFSPNTGGINMLVFPKG
jgi:hypothetical protein